MHSSFQKRYIAPILFIASSCIAFYAPKVTQLPSKTVRESDNNTLLVCRVDGLPSPYVTWAYNGIPIPPSEPIKSLDLCQYRQRGFYRSSPYSLTICDLKSKEHQGKYTCTATNKIGQHSKTMMLTVLGRFRIRYNFSFFKSCLYL